MASEALGEADKSFASPPSNKAAAELLIDGNSSNGRQSHVSDMRADANQQQQSNDDGYGSSEMAASQAPSTQKANATMCGICESNPGKYKCSRCRLP